LDTKNLPVVIVGAGLSGLACAMTLHRKEIPYLLIEKSTEVGGRVQTDVTSEGLRLDHGFQVLLTSYPELKNFLDLDSLKLKKFNSGSLIYTPNQLSLLANPFIHPNNLIGTLFSNLSSLKDKFLVVKLILSLKLDLVRTSHAISTLAFLKNFGFSEKFIDLFWQPFCAGIFLDKKLEIRSDYFVFLLKNFSSGRVAIPELGMHQIPLQMLNTLNTSNIKLGTNVKEFSDQLVILDNGEKIQARAVICAYNPVDHNNEFRSVINYYFTTRDSLPLKKWLLLVPEKFGFCINNISILSEVSDAYTKDDEHLISVSILDSVDPGTQVVTLELQKILSSAIKFKYINKFTINNALPKYFTDEQTHIEKGIYHCGDHLSSPSINGALMSGRITAEKVIFSIIPSADSACVKKEIG
jgi:hypothetical protein